jgi:NADH-quinone oxidoreductase subunit L
VGLAVAAFVVGGGLATLLYWRRPELPARIRTQLAGLHRAVENKYWVDEAYDAAFVRPLVAVSDEVLYQGIDARGIDGIVNGGARGIRGLAARGLKHAQSGLAQSYLFFMILGTVAILGWLMR